MSTNAPIIVNSPTVNFIGYSGDKWFCDILLENTNYFGSGDVWYIVEPGTGRLLDLDDMIAYSDLMAIYNKAVHLNVRAAMRAQQVDQSPLNINRGK